MLHQAVFDYRRCEQAVVSQSVCYPEIYLPHQEKSWYGIDVECARDAAPMQVFEITLPPSLCGLGTEEIQSNARLSPT